MRQENDFEEVKMKAYKQGTIDYFCAIYAIINAIRQAAGKYHYFNIKEATAFYQHLMTYLFNNKKFLEVLYEGTSLDLMKELLAETKKYLFDTYNLKVHYRRVLKYNDMPIKKFETFVSNYLKKNNVSCLLRLYNKEIGDHWSVIEKKCLRYRLSLFDSYVYPYIDVRFLTFEPYRDDKLTHLVRESVTFIKIYK